MTIRTRFWGAEVGPNLRLTSVYFKFCIVSENTHLSFKNEYTNKYGYVLYNLHKKDWCDFFFNHVKNT